MRLEFVYKHQRSLRIRHVGSPQSFGRERHIRMSVAHIGDDPDDFMPKGRNAKSLTPAQIGVIRAWIDQGAK